MGDLYHVSLLIAIKSLTGPCARYIAISNKRDFDDVTCLFFRNWRLGAIKLETKMFGER
jgi:hypothetical protein